MGDLQKLKITPDGKIYLGGCEICNVKSYELKSSAEGLAELSIKLDVVVGSVGVEPEYVRVPYTNHYVSRRQLHTDPQQPKEFGRQMGQRAGDEDNLQECPCPQNLENSDL